MASSPADKAIALMSSKMSRLPTSTIESIPSTQLVPLGRVLKITVLKPLQKLDQVIGDRARRPTEARYQLKDYI